MTPQNLSQQTVEVAGWQVHLTTYQLGEEWHCTADDVSPGANLARVKGASKEEVEQKALARAAELLANTKRHAI